MRIVPQLPRTGDAVEYVEGILPPSLSSLGHRACVITDNVDMWDLASFASLGLEEKE